jgi:hypothetical protein
MLYKLKFRTENPRAVVGHVRDFCASSRKSCMDHSLSSFSAATVDVGILRSVWEELDYRIDICRVTKRSDIEHL